MDVDANIIYILACENMRVYTLGSVLSRKRGKEAMIVAKKRHTVNVSRTDECERHQAFIGSSFWFGDIFCFGCCFVCGSDSRTTNNNQEVMHRASLRHSAVSIPKSTSVTE